MNTPMHIISKEGWGYVPRGEPLPPDVDDIISGICIRDQGDAYEVGLFEFSPSARQWVFVRALTGFATATEAELAGVKKWFPAWLESQ